MQVSINITRADAERIYNTILNEKLIEKAKEEYMKFADIKEISWINNAAMDKFYKEYGVDFEKSVRKSHKEYILDDIVETYKTLSSPDISESQTWISAIKTVLNNRQNS